MKDGGQAFPRHYEQVIGSKLEETEMIVLRSVDGMSLRDYFAGQVLMTYRPSTTSPEQDIAKACYRVADALIAERERQPTDGK